MFSYLRVGLKWYSSVGNVDQTFTIHHQDFVCSITQLQVLIMRNSKVCIIACDRWSASFILYIYIDYGWIYQSMFAGWSNFQHSNGEREPNSFRDKLWETNKTRQNRKETEKQRNTILYCVTMSNLVRKINIGHCQNKTVLNMMRFVILLCGTTVPRQ